MEPLNTLDQLIDLFGPDSDVRYRVTEEKGRNRRNSLLLDGIEDEGERGVEKLVEALQNSHQEKLADILLQECWKKSEECLKRGKLEVLSLHMLPVSNCVLLPTSCPRHR